MQHVLYFTALLLFAVGCQMLGCGDASSPTVESGGGEEPAGPGAILAAEPLDPKPVVLELTPAEKTFARLRNLFPQPIVDANFATLRKVVATNTYLDFLTQEFPTAEPFQTFEGYLQGAPPDTARYRPFLKKWVENPTAEDVELIQWLVGESRAVNLILFRFKVNAVGDPFQALKQMFDKKFGALGDSRVEAFLARHDIAEVEFIDAFDAFVVETEKADARWLNAQFEEQNDIDAGLLWSALRKPTLIGEILNNFSDEDVFLKWVEVTAVRDEADEIGNE